MTKDYLKFRNAIKKDANLSLEEGYMLETLFDYYNTSIGYAYPSYEVLMSDLKTKRKAKISKLLKSLVNKGYIMITKKGKKNTYKLLKYLFISNDKSLESDDNMTLENQDQILDITEVEQEVIDLGFTHKQAKSLLQAAKYKIDKVIKAVDYVAQKGADNIYAYTIWAINNINKIKTTFKSAEDDWSPKTNFDNFKPREYDYKDLEKRLLGWG